jgi:hypothetical protein
VFAVVALGAAIGMWQPRSTGRHAAPAEHAALHYLEGGIDLIGYDVSMGQAVPGESIPLTLYWKAREPIPENYQVFVHLTTVPEHTWAQSDKLNPGDYPTTRWPLDRYVRDPHSLTIPPGTPPGTYMIRVGLWNHGTGRRQLVLEEDGTILGDSVALPVQVTVSSPATPPDIGTLPIEAFSAEEVAPGVTLLGAAIQPGTVFDLPMGQLTVELYWRADAANLPDYLVAIQLVADNGLPTGNLREPITDGNYPPSAWRAGDIVRDVHSLWIDSTVPAGEYTIQVGLHEPSERDVERWHNLGQVERILP